jgi:hypothetical protein
VSDWALVCIGLAVPTVPSLFFPVFTFLRLPSALPSFVGLSWFSSTSFFLPLWRGASLSSSDLDADFLLRDVLLVRGREAVSPRFIALPVCGFFEKNLCLILAAFYITSKFQYAIKWIYVSYKYENGESIGLLPVL